MNTVLIITSLFALFILGPRPRLDSRPRQSLVPHGLTVAELKSWLQAQEAAVDNLTEGAEAHIQWADPEHPAKTALCFLYLHGFSATRQETAPVTEQIAGTFGANAYHARLHGHGVGPEGMDSPSESWLQSVLDAWQIASQLGERVVIVATSTGAPLTIWLIEHIPEAADKIHALLLMSPNYKIKNRFGFLLTWPWARYFVPWLIGKRVSWEPENELSARYWTSAYSYQAVIEMQKVVDWVKAVDFSGYTIPLATMYMKNDTTIDPDAAIDRHNSWGGTEKQLIPVAIDGDAHEHVFAGYITGPHRVDWCVAEFTRFLKTLGT